MYRHWRKGVFYPVGLPGLWAGQIRGLRNAGKEVYVYFNNDWGGYAIRDVRKLRELLGAPQ